MATNAVSFACCVIVFGQHRNLNVKAGAQENANSIDVCNKTVYKYLRVQKHRA